MLKIAWYIAPYKRRENSHRPTRYCAMDDYTQQIIYKDGGNWSETEVLGDRAIVKVKAEEKTIETLDTVFKRLPVDSLDSGLTTKTAEVKTSISSELADMGYKSSDTSKVNLDTCKAVDLLKVMATKRLAPRYDAEKDLIICDGIEQQCRSIESVDKAVK